MRKLTGIFVGGALLLFFSSSLFSGTIAISGATSGTYEYFGAAKVIHPTGIQFQLGVQYQTNDILTFSLPSGFLFENDNTVFKLIAKSLGKTTFYEDPDGEGVNDWAFISGGKGASSVTFRASDPNSTYFAALTTWFLASAETATPGSGSMQIKVPALPASSDSGTEYEMGAASTLAGTGLPFDTTADEVFFTSYYEYEIDPKTPGANTVDVEQAREYFTDGTGADTSDAFATITAQSATYATAPLVGGTTDYWKFTVTGDMQGVKELQVRQAGNVTTNAPADANTAVVEVPGTKMGTTFPIMNTLTIQVVGDEGLNERSLSLTGDFQGADDAAQDFADRTFHPTQANAWVWDTNGTVFRTAWFATAHNLPSYTSFRIVNDSGTPAEVYADIWFDGQPTAPSATFQNVGTVPANDKLSLTAYDMCVAAGLTPSLDTSGDWKGRCRLTVWAPRSTTYGVELHYTPTGYTSIPLEKQTPTGTTWWEK